MLNAVGKRVSFQKFEYQKGAFLVFPDVIQRADVRVIDGGGRSRFPSKSVDILRYGAVVRDEFERDFSPKAQIGGTIDSPHPAAAYLFENSIGADGFTDADHESGRIARGSAWRKLSALRDGATRPGLKRVMPASCCCARNEDRKH